MEKQSSPKYYAVHPAWAGEMQAMDSGLDIQKIKAQADADYLGPAAILATKGFNPDDVYQISENEYYSYGDGLRYYVAENGRRIALINLQGLLYAGYGWNDYKNAAEKIKAAEHPAYAGALIMANSPGGHTAGMRKLNAAIADFSKPIGVHVSGMLASAAAFIAAPADFIAADPEEKNTFGSIGVFTVKQNYSKMNEKEGIEVAVIRSEGADEKFKPNPYEPWTDEDLAKVQAAINKEAEDFLNAMAVQRKITAENLEKIKSGADYDTDEAFALGLHDGKATFEQAINKLANYQLLFI